MEESWENWHLHMEMDRDDDFLDKCYTDDDKFLSDILLQQPAFSSKSESDNPFYASSMVQNNSTPNMASATGGGILSSENMSGLEGHGNIVKSDSSNSTVSQNASKRPNRSSSPRTYILSFDNSTMTPATPEPNLNSDDQLLGSEGKRSSNSPLPSKRTLPEPRRPVANQGTKKTRSSSLKMDHILAERKRRQELTERFIALSAAIPGLNKTDKASILRAAIDHVKQLQERVQELEKQDKKRGEESVILIKKYDLCADEDTTCSETSSDDCATLPEIEGRILGKEVLIQIHCVKENGIELKILDQLENLQLCVTGSSVLPFGNSTLGITIIAQMGEAYNMTVDDLVKNLGQVFMKSYMACHSDPY